MARLLGSMGGRDQQIAKGLNISSSVIGQTIPFPYGRDRASAILIYDVNFRAKKGVSKKGTDAKGRLTGYYVDADFLLGFGPIQQVSSVWFEKNSYVCVPYTQEFTGSGNASYIFTVTNVPQNQNSPNVVVSILGVTRIIGYDVTYNDYGNPRGSVHYAGTTELPLYNAAFPGPNSGDYSSLGIAYAKYNIHTTGSFPIEIYLPAPGTVAIKVYYLFSLGGPDGGGFPIRYAGDIDTMSFERELGSGLNPIAYPDFSGISGENINLGISNLMTNFSYEVNGLYSYSPTGDCNPADIIADIICSGNMLNFWDGTFPPPIWQHGCNFTNFAPTQRTGGIPSTGPYLPGYTRYGGILDDEPNFWGSLAPNNGTNLGLNLVRNFCQSFGIYLSQFLSTAQKAAQHLDDLMEISGSAACYDGAQLKIIPYCEQSNFGNGASFVPPCASGPVATFTDVDYITKDAHGQPQSPLTIERMRPQDNFNSLTIEFVDRTTTDVDKTGHLEVGQYNTNQVIVADQADISVQGPMPGTVKNFHWIKDPVTASNVGWMILRRQLLSKRYIYKWKSSARFGFLTLMDLVTLKDPNLPEGQVDVRITKITQHADYTIDFEAEKFIYGVSVPLPPAVTPAQGSGGSGGGNQNQDPGSVNTPIFFEPIPAIADKPQIWICISGSSQYFGGSAIWLSTDGGSNYTMLATWPGNQTMGAVATSNYPSHSDPDGTNTLHVDLTESLGTLESFTAGQRDLFQSLSYLSPGGTVVVNGITLTIPYELIAYENANLTAPSKYDLPPSIRRGVYNTPITTHNVAQAFSFLEDGVVYKLDLPQSWIGTTLYFKFTAFNIYGGNEQSLSDATAYTFTPTGLVGWNNGWIYTIAPNPAVFQGKTGGWSGILNADGTTDSNASTWTDPTKVYFPGLFANFTNPPGQHPYAARDSGLSVFTDSSGGQQAWITIYDPGLLGEPSGSPTLTAYADLNQTRWNSPGYIRVGTIVSQQYSSGGGGGTGGGGGSGGGPGPNDFYIYIPPVAGTYAGSQELYFSQPVRNITLPQSLSNSAAGCRTAPTGSITVTLKKNGSSIGTVNIAAGQTTATFTFSAAVSFNGVSDTLQVVAPSSPDTTFTGFWLNLYATRSN